MFDDALLPYSIMAGYKPSPAQVAACRWMTDADLDVYSQQFQRTGFQGGLNYYRVDGVFGPTRDSMRFPARRSTSRLVASEVRTNGPCISPRAHLNACTRYVRDFAAFIGCMEQGIPSASSLQFRKGDAARAVENALENHAEDA